MATAHDQAQLQPPVESLVDNPVTDAAESVDPPNNSTPDASATPSNITPPNSANGNKRAPDGGLFEPSNPDLDASASAPANPPQEEQPAPVDDQQDVEPDHYYGGGRIPVFKPVSRFHLCLLRMSYARIF